jgi:biofilm protein TabA
MAIIGNIYKLEKFFTDIHLIELYDYLKESLDIDSEINKRLLKLNIDSFIKDLSIDTCNVFHQSAITKERKNCFIESHKKYVDIQLLINGYEQMEYVDIDKLIIKEKYNEEKDLTIYDNYEHTSKILLQKSDVAIFFPDDGHIGQAMYNKKSLINKIVVKVPIEAFEIKKRQNN